MGVNEIRGATIFFALGNILIPIGLALWLPFLGGAPAYGLFSDLQRAEAPVLYLVGFDFIIVAWFLRTDKPSKIPLEFGVLGIGFFLGGLFCTAIFPALIGSALLPVSAAGLGFIMGSATTAGMARRRRPPLGTTH